MNHGSVPPQPRLTPSLLGSLAAMYSSHHAALPSMAANDFLINIQSRNIRRKIQSFKQKQTDKPQTGKPADASTIEMGSTWLACLWILCRTAVDGYVVSSSTRTEQLFCAQTLLQRLRRSKLFEAVDWEIEQPQDIDSEYAVTLFQSNDFLLQLIPSYVHWASSINPLVGAVLENYSVGTMDDEDKLKGELSLLTLASLVYQIACAPADHQTGPILSTLGACMATLALRLRYSPASVDQHADGANPNCPPLVPLVTHSLAVVWESCHRRSRPINARPFGASLHACLAALPDTLLGSPGGARGRLSIDPRCVQAATVELQQSGLVQLWETLQSQQQQYASLVDEAQIDLWTLSTCLAWAKYLPVPPELGQHLAFVVNKYMTSEDSPHRRMALALLIALCEGAALTVQEILSFSLGLSEQQLPAQAHKKRQSSKSKKRQKDLLQANATDELLEKAEAEVRLRGETACNVTLAVWDSFRPIVMQALGSSNAAEESVLVEGEGPIGCLAAVANACLPYLVRYPSFQHSLDLFREVAGAFQQLCHSPNKAVRGLTMEPTYTLHERVLDVVRNFGSFGETFESLVVDHLFKCSMGLAAFCAYPARYFDDLRANSDEELEVERNDVRDLLRAVTGSGETGSTSDSKSDEAPMRVALQVLFHLLQACEKSVASAYESQQLFEESVVHAFSSLAKPLNHLARCLPSVNSAGSHDILRVALKIMQQSGEIVAAAFKHPVSLNQLLPVSRVANIAIASLAPMFASLSTLPEMTDSVVRVVDVCIQATMSSIAQLPELASESVLGANMYDIRGTMTGPGGEDHVGCVALRRLAFENDEFTRFLSKATPHLVHRLCELHQNLKSIEVERGPNVWHGSGVTPASRRMLLNVICHIELLSNGQAGASDMLGATYHAAVSSIASLKGSPLDASGLFHVCEAVFDIVAFPPVVVRTLFTLDGGQEQGCLEVVTAACLDGYRGLSFSCPPDEMTIQWNRLRGSLFKLLRLASSPELPPRASQMMVAMVESECLAIRRQCDAGPASSSSLFNDDVVSADGFPAGVFVRAVGDVVHEQKSERAPLEAMCTSVETLQAMSASVLASVCLRCPVSSAFADPRPAMLEAWLSVMVELMDEATMLVSATVGEVLLETFGAVVNLLFFPQLGKTAQDRACEPGLSFDGPQSLAITDFLGSFFALGPSLLEKAALMTERSTVVDFGNVRCDDRRLCGVAIIGAGLFRAVQGGLPPWAVESIPEIYSALYNAMGKDPIVFGHCLQLAIAARLSPNEVEPLGGVAPGERLSGRIFDGFSTKAIETFLQQAVQICRKDDASSWRRLKVLIKTLCGGKKKDTDFGQKPPQTKWDFDRM